MHRQHDPKTATRIRKLRHKVGRNGWQSRLDDRISRLKEQGFTIIAADEAFFTCDTKSRRKYWSFVGARIMRPYNGNHKKIIAYGAVADDGRQLFRMHKRFDGPTFLLYVKELSESLAR